jgi:FkbM family methyltransferase
MTDAAPRESSFRQRPDFGDCLEILLSRIYHSIIRPGDIVIDGGANGGLHALPLGRLIGSGGRLFAYEPLPHAFHDLMEAVVSTGLDDRLVLRNVAIGGEHKHMTFYRHKTDLGLSSARRMNDTDDWIELQVDFVRLDDEPIPIGVAFIKLDLEGGERDALVGARQIIARDRPVVAFENGFEWPAERFGYTIASFWNFFADLDYEVCDFLGTKARSESDFSDKRLVWQLIAIPSESPLKGAILAEIATFNACHATIPRAADWGEVVQRVHAPDTLPVQTVHNRLRRWFLLLEGLPRPTPRSRDEDRQVTGRQARRG